MAHSSGNPVPPRHQVLTWAGISRDSAFLRSDFVFDRHTTSATRFDESLVGAADVFRDELPGNWE